MKIRAAVLALLSLISAGFAQQPSAPAAVDRDYCRFVGDDLRGKLETSIVTMKNAAGVSVELIGAVHIADPAYYRSLNDLFKGYEVLLFELVDGQTLKDDLEDTEEEPPVKKGTGKIKLAEPAEATAPAESPAEKLPTKTPRARGGGGGDGAFTMLRFLMTGIGTYFKLEYQTTGIDYHAKNFVHADVSMDEFLRLQEEKGESWGTLFQKSIEAQLKRGVNKDDEPKGSQLLLALLGDSSGIKISMAKMLGQIENHAGEIGFGADSVIVGERNRVALEVFDREVKAGRKNLGIFYGAAHLSDLEKRLENRGYHRTGERWLTAWDIKPSADQKK